MLCKLRQVVAVVDKFRVVARLFRALFAANCCINKTHSSEVAKLTVHNIEEEVTTLTPPHSAPRVLKQSFFVCFCVFVFVFLISSLSAVGLPQDFCNLDSHVSQPNPQMRMMAMATDTAVDVDE